VLGGVGTLGIIALWAWIFPELRRTGALSTLKSALAEAENRSLHT
jgi:hypothetical protein